MNADLHIHSWYSDGSMTIDEILNQAQLNQVGLIAVTDHNQLSGSRECLRKCEAWKIQCLSGVELDAQQLGINFHILGYGMDLENSQFNEFVETNCGRLERVNALLIEKMEQAGESVSLKEYQQFSYDRQWGGWKALHYFAAKGIVANYRQALLEILPTIMETGLDGIECWYPSHDHFVTQTCLKYCQDRGLMITSGADCHGVFEKTTIGQMAVPISQLELKDLI